MDSASRHAPDSPVLETPPPEPAGGTALMALLAVSPPSQPAREIGERLGGQILGGISSQGGMELAVIAFPSTAAAIRCSREVLEAPGGESSAIGLHLGEVALPASPGEKGNTDRESVRIASGLSQQADEGSALLSQTFYEIVRGEAEVPANYMGPKQIRLVPRTVPVFKLNLGDERANRKNVVSKQMDMILLEERQRAQEDRERQKKQARLMGYAFLVLLMVGFGALIISTMFQGKDKQSVIGLLKATITGDFTQDMNVRQVDESAASPSSTSPQEIEAPASNLAPAQGFQQLLNGGKLSPDAARAAYCQGLYHLVVQNQGGEWEVPEDRLAKALQSTSRGKAEAQIISAHYLAELAKAQDVGLFQEGNALERLGQGLPPHGYKVIQLLPPERFPQVALFPANFALRRSGYVTSPNTPPVEAVQLLQKLKAAGLVQEAPKAQ